MFRGHPALGYVVAFASVGAATALQWWAGDFYQDAPFITIYPAVVVTAFVGGYPAGWPACRNGISSFRNTIGLRS